MRPRTSRCRGMTILESLLSLFFFLGVILAGLEFFGTGRTVFFKLQDAQSAREAAWTALDKIRGDVVAAGRGLLQAESLGLVQGIEDAEGVLTLLSVDTAGALRCDAAAGQSVLVPDTTDGFSSGQLICILDRTKGEVRTINVAGATALEVAPPLNGGYLQSETRLLRLRKIAYYLDAPQSVLRRKVNASPAQPLLEGVASVGFDSDGQGGLVQVRIVLRTAPEKPYTAAIFPINMAIIHAN